MIQSNSTVEDIINQLLEIPANYAFTVIKNEQCNVCEIIPVVKKNQLPNKDAIDIKDTSVQIQELSYAAEDVNFSVARIPLAQLEDSTMYTSLAGESTDTKEEVG